MIPVVGVTQGYRSSAYLGALSCLGRAVVLEGSGTALIARAVPGTGREDLMGPYPFLSADDWPNVLAKLERVSGNYVALSFVTDPFCPMSLDDLSDRFDVARVMNDQYIVDLTAPSTPSRHHRRKLRMGREGLTLDLRVPTREDAAAFESLYATLVDRKNICDFRAFDRESLLAQVLAPGALIVEARLDGLLAGMDLYYVDGAHAHAHLSAYADVGYALSVSYPMMAFAIEALGDYANALNLGGAPAAGGDGIRHFKKGWSQATRPSFLCGRILDQKGYARIAGSSFDPQSYFPAYRAGEFSRDQ